MASTWLVGSRTPHGRLDQPAYITCEPCRNRTTTYAHHYINAFAEEKRRLAKTAAQASVLALFCSSTEEAQSE